MSEQLNHPNPGEQQQNPNQPQPGQEQPDQPLR